MKSTLFVKAFTLTFFVVSITGFVLYKSGTFEYEDPNDFSKFLLADNTLYADTSKKPIIVFPSSKSAPVIAPSSKSIVIKEPTMQRRMSFDSARLHLMMVRYREDSIRIKTKLTMMSSSKSMPVITPEFQESLRKFQLLKDSVDFIRMLQNQRDASKAKKQ